MPGHNPDSTMKTAKMLRERIRRMKAAGPIRIVLVIILGLSLLSLLRPDTNDLRRSLVHDNIKRTFKIHLPSGYDRTEHLPLIITLHGRGGNGESMVLLTRSGFNKLADRDRFIVVYPDGIERNWNDGRKDEQSNDRAHRENLDDVGFISDLIDQMIRKYNADPSAVYVTGISNGAIMCYRLACELSEKIAAIAPVDGNIPYTLADQCSSSRPVSVLAINNTDDPLVPYEGGDIYSKIPRVNLGRVLSANESVFFWVKRDSCRPTPEFFSEPDTDPKDGTTVSWKRFSGGTEGTEVILYSVKGGGHTWPGGFQYLPVWIIGKTSRDFDANVTIWTFFKKHSRK
jgi:polyhydroxybutyrate depolymerase